MTKAFVTSAIAAAALLSGTAAFAAGKPHATSHGTKVHATKVVKTQTVKTPKGK